MRFSALKNLKPVFVHQNFDLETVNGVGVFHLVGAVLIPRYDAVQDGLDQVDEIRTAETRVAASHSPDIHLMRFPAVRLINDISPVTHTRKNNDRVVDGIARYFF